jgi:hypothetical protein
MPSKLDEILWGFVSWVKYAIGCQKVTTDAQGHI